MNKTPYSKKYFNTKKQYRTEKYENKLYCIKYYSHERTKVNVCRWLRKSYFGYVDSFLHHPFSLFLLSCGFFCVATCVIKFTFCSCLNKTAMTTMKTTVQTLNIGKLTVWKSLGIAERCCFPSLSDKLEAHLCIYIKIIQFLQFP